MVVAIILQHLMLPPILCYFAISSDKGDKDAKEY